MRLGGRPVGPVSVLLIRTWAQNTMAPRSDADQVAYVKIHARKIAAISCHRIT